MFFITGDTLVITQSFVIVIWAIVKLGYKY